MKKHAEHNLELSSLNRVLGQLNGVKNMITENRYCIDILTQLKASRHAIKTIELNILENHLSHCLHNAVKSGDIQEITTKINEIKFILKRFME